MHGCPQSKNHIPKVRPESPFPGATNPPDQEVQTRLRILRRAFRRSSKRLRLHKSCLYKLPSQTAKAALGARKCSDFAVPNPSRLSSTPLFRRPCLQTGRWTFVPVQTETERRS